MSETAELAAAVPPEERCIWPGCTRRRAPGRTSGSGRQKEYCLQADPPAAGGGPVHNARNRWVALRHGELRADDGAGDGADRPDGAEAHGGGTGPAPAGRAPDAPSFTAAKQRASTLLEQARQQHAAAMAGLRTERELYEQVAEQFRVLTDPAALDLDLATIASRAGREIAQAEQDAADARRAQLAAEQQRDEALRLRDEAADAAGQSAEDADAAELALAEASAVFERDRQALAERARAAEERAGQAANAARQQVADAEERIRAAARDAQQVADVARARADDAIDRAQRQAADALADARARIAEAREQAAEQVSAARGETDRARAVAERSTVEAEQARAAADAVRAAVQAELGDARDRAAAAQAATAAAEAKAAAAAAETDRLREGHAAELARLGAAHQSALSAERARAERAEHDLAALRADLAAKAGD